MVDVVTFPIHNRLELLPLVLYSHGFRIHCLFPSHTFKTGENATIFILVCLKNETALLVSFSPYQPDKVFFGLAQRGKRPET
jgi:hypothetical protein